MGKTYRNNSGDNKGKYRKKNNRKAKSFKQDYENFHSSDLEETELTWDEYSTGDGIFFEKFSKKNKRK